MIVIKYNNKMYKTKSNISFDVFLKSNDITLNNKNYYFAKIRDNYIFLDNSFNIKWSFEIISISKKDDQLLNIYFQDIGKHLLILALMQYTDSSCQIINTIIKDDTFYIEFISKDFCCEKALIKLTNQINKIKKKNVLLNKDIIDNCLITHFTNIPNYISIKLYSISSVELNIEDKIINGFKIQGSCFSNSTKLQDYESYLQERKENDHRFINKKLRYYSMSSDIGGGLPLWTEYGTTLRNLIEKFIDNIQINQFNYNKIKTAPIGHANLYKKSGHLTYYHDTMFPAINTEHGDFILRPMTCPHHCIYFNQQLISYRDLPYKLYETSPLFRYEKSGALKGLERTRWMTLSDCHTFLKENQIFNHIQDIFAQLDIVFKTFNIKFAYYRLGIPDNIKEKYNSTDGKIWKKSIDILTGILKKSKVKYRIGKGDAAFYAPKIDVQIINSLGFEITLATIQLDFMLPKQFDLNFINKDGNKERPIIVHHSIIGTYERFISILMEQNKGYMPFLFSPLQFVIIPVNNNHLVFCNELQQELKNLNYRTHIDNKEHRLGFKIREYELLKPSYLIIIGDVEIKNNTVSYRDIKNNQSYILQRQEFIAMIKKMKI